MLYIVLSLAILTISFLLALVSLTFIFFNLQRSPFKVNDRDSDVITTRFY
jgi:hypothetical protein